MLKSHKPVSVVDYSKNAKTGLVSATYAPLQSCPDSCRFKNSGCYGQSGNCNFTFSRVTRNADRLQASDLNIANWEATEIMKLEGDLPLRLHVTGDCKSDETAKVVSKAAEKYSAIANQPAWVYTHAWKDVDRSSWGKVNVLASVETATDALEANLKGYSVAFVTPIANLTDNLVKVAQAGLKAKLCNNFSKGTTCKKCRVCFDTDTTDIDVVLLPTHGATVKQADRACQAK